MGGTARLRSTSWRKKSRASSWWPAYRCCRATPVVILLNFAMFFAILRLAGNWGLLWTPVFLLRMQRGPKPRI
jgi:hypothetical protein